MNEWMQSVEAKSTFWATELLHHGLINWHPFILSDEWNFWSYCAVKARFLFLLDSNFLKFNVVFSHKQNNSNCSNSLCVESVVKNCLASRWKNVAPTKAWYLFISWRTNWLLHRLVVNKSNLFSAVDSLTHTHSQVWIVEVILQWLQLCVCLFVCYNYIFFLFSFSCFCNDIWYCPWCYYVSFKDVVAVVSLSSPVSVSQSYSFIFFLYTLSLNPPNPVYPVHSK